MAKYSEKRHLRVPSDREFSGYMLTYAVRVPHLEHTENSKSF